MNGRTWRTAYASVIGTSHLKSETPCQDAGICRAVTAMDGRELLIAAVSDGAGTATRSAAGAALAVKSFLETFTEAAILRPGLEDVDRSFALEWLAGLKMAISDLAVSEGIALREYACTMLGAVVSPTSSVFLQVGDGAIVVGADRTGDLAWVFWPQHGEFANQTNFVIQDNIDAVLDFEAGENSIEEIALFSDGIERLVLDFASRTVHAPSFRPILDWLATREPSASLAPSEALIAYLGSDHVNGRTDDDKTLVLATRAVPPSSAA